MTSCGFRGTLAQELAGNRIPVAVTCRVLNLSRQPYRGWLVDPVTDESGRLPHVFTAESTNQLGLTNITEHRTTSEGKLYLCAVKDVFSNKIIGYSIGFRMKSGLAMITLNNAVAMRGDVVGCVVHSDRGSQFRSRQYLRAVARHRMVGSMGRVAS